MTSTPEPATLPVGAIKSTNSLSLPSLCLNLKDEANALLHFLHEVSPALCQALTTHPNSVAESIRVHLAVKEMSCCKGVHYINNITAVNMTVLG